jgi:hypothetical protein
VVFDELNLSTLFQGIRNPKQATSLQSRSTSTTSRNSSNNGYLLIYKVRFVAVQLSQIHTLLPIHELFTDSFTELSLKPLTLYYCCRCRCILYQQVSIISDTPQGKPTSSKELASSVVSRWSESLHFLYPKRESRNLSRTR